MNDITTGWGHERDPHRRWMRHTYQVDQHVFRSLAQAEAALAEYAGYFNYHRLHGELGWLTPAERFDGTPFTDRGFEHIPAP